jgi:hypothetical protein
LKGLKRETIRARLEEAALQLADADDSAKECWHLFGKDAPETRDAQRRRREVRDRIVGLGHSLRRRLDQEAEQRQRDEEREDQKEREKWTGL